jgi:hypothetical protein
LKNKNKNKKFKEKGLTMHNGCAISGLCEGECRNTHNGEDCPAHYYFKYEKRQKNKKGKNFCQKKIEIKYS